MKYCENCGAQISDDAAFCSECGSETGIKPTDKETNKVAINPNVVIIGIFAVILMILVIVLALIITKNADKGKNDNSIVSNSSISQEVISESISSESIEPVVSQTVESIEMDGSSVSEEYPEEENIDEFLPGSYLYEDEYYTIAAKTEINSDNIVSVRISKESSITGSLVEASISGILAKSDLSDYTFMISCDAMDSWLNNINVKVYFEPDKEIVFIDSRVESGDFEQNLELYNVLTLVGGREVKSHGGSFFDLADGRYRLSYWSYEIRDDSIVIDASIMDEDTFEDVAERGTYTIPLSSDVKFYEWVDFSEYQQSLDEFRASLDVTQLRLDDMFNEFIGIVVEYGEIVRIVRYIV